MKKRIYSIIEVKSRELNAKILFSIQMANQGYSVVLGKKKNLYRYAKYFKRGIFFFKGMGPRNRKPMQDITKLNHKIVGYDEEGMVMNMPSIIPLRIDSTCMKLVDYFFTVGDIQKKNTLKCYSNYKDKIVSVGNLRFDLMKKQIRNIYKNEVELIKKKYGNFILFPSKFTIINNYYFRKLPPDLLKRNDVKTDFDDQKKVEKKLLKFFNSFIKKNPKIKILVKMHPVERKEYWIKLVKKINKENFIFVNDKLSTNAYLLASEFSVASNCHTSLEAYLFDKPTINWRTSTKDSYVTSKIIRAVSKEILTQKELEKIIYDWYIKNRKFKNTLTITEQNILNNNIKNVNKFSVVFLKKYFDKIKIPKVINTDLYSNPISYFYFIIINKIKNFYHLYKADQNKINFYRAKFDGLAFEEYKSIIEKFCKTMNLNIKNFKLKEIYPGCFNLEKK